MALGVAIGVAAFVNNDTSSRPAVTLSLDAQDSAASCLAFDTVVLANMPTAFAGSVEDVSDDGVVLNVTHWYKGGDAPQVRLTTIALANSGALIGGIEFRRGREYLITAWDGQVSHCGYSTAATDEMRAVFDAAFGS